MPETKSLKVGVAQLETILGDVDAALERHLALVDEARARHVDILLFPELSLTGHGGGSDAPRLAMRRDDPRLARLAAASRGMTTVVGCIEEGPGVQFYNAALALRDGGILFLHRKVNLATYGRLEEGKHYARGPRVEVLRLDDDWRVGLLVCADLWNPALVHLGAIQGATLLLAPVSSAVEAVGADFDNPGGWEVNLRFHAMTYGMFVAMANRVGVEGDLTFWGGSRILDPFGRVVVQAEGRREGIIAAELDFDLLRTARYLLPGVRDADTDLVLRELRRIRGDGLAVGEGTP